MDTERSTLKEESKKKKKGFGFDIFTLTLIISIVCAISAFLRIKFNYPAILVPFRIYNGTYEIAPEFVQNYPDVTVLNKVENVIEAFFLAVFTSGLFGNYWKHHVHYYSTFVVFMLISSITCLIRLIYTIFLYILYPINNTANDECQQNKTFWLHIIGYILSIFVYLLMAFIVLKARKNVLDSKLGISEPEANLWKFWTAREKREHWAENEPNQQTIDD